MSNLSPQSKQSCLAEVGAAAAETNLDAVDANSWRISLDMEEEVDPRMDDDFEEEELEEEEKEVDEGLRRWGLESGEF